MELKSNEEKITRALLVSVDTGEYDAQASLDELFELVKSAGADPVLSVTQNLQKIERVLLSVQASLPRLPKSANRRR